MPGQEALFHAPGTFSALSLWNRESGASDWGINEVLRALPSRLAAPSLHCLIAVEARWVENQKAPPLLPSGPFPSTQADLLIQLASPSRELLLNALHRLAATVAGVFQPAEEILGGRLGEGREAFGFRDALIPPSAEDIQRTALVTTGEQTGASWLLYLRFQQDLSRFERLKLRDQERIVGKTREAEPLPKLDEDSHVSRMRSAGAGENRAFIRRSFPFRQEREEGLAFVGASSDPGRFAYALEAMHGGKDRVPDALMRYAQPVSGGLYLAPRQEWFASFGTSP